MSDQRVLDPRKSPVDHPDRAWYAELEAEWKVQLRIHQIPKRVLGDAVMRFAVGGKVQAQNRRADS